MLYPAVLYPIGAILLAVVGWRTTALPRVAAALFALSGVLLAIPLPLHTFRLAGGVVMLIAGVWVAVIVRRATTRPPAQPR